MTATIQAIDEPAGTIYVLRRPGLPAILADWPHPLLELAPDAVRLPALTGDFETVVAFGNVGAPVRPVWEPLEWSPARLAELDRIRREKIVERDRIHDETCAVCKQWIDWRSSVAGIRIELIANGKGRWRNHRWWSLCALCAMEGLPPPPAGKPDATGKIRPPKIPDEDMVGIYRAYVKGSAGLEEVIKHLGLVQRYGFASTRSCSVWITHRLRAWGLPMRTRSESRKANSARRGPTVSKRIGEKRARAAYVLHTRNDMSINEIARLKYEEWGYASANSACSGISSAWKALGLEARDRIEMTVVKSTTNGLSPRKWKDRRRLRLEAGLTVKGKERQPVCAHEGCAKPSKVGDVYCTAHDPATRERTLDRLALMRATSFADRVDGTEVIEALRAYWESEQSWKRLCATTGYSNTVLGRFRGYPPGQMMKPETVERLRAGLAEATSPIRLAV